MAKDCEAIYSFVKQGMIVNEGDEYYIPEEDRWQPIKKSQVGDIYGKNDGQILRRKNPEREFTYKWDESTKQGEIERRHSLVLKSAPLTLSQMVIADICDHLNQCYEEGFND